MRLAVRLDEAEAAGIIGLMRDVAAAEIMPRFGRLKADEIRTKAGPLDLVTAADEAAEAALTAGLARLFPDTAVFGEEAASADPSTLTLLKGSRPVFVIDPIDGTANYAAGLPLFGVMIALVVDGETEAGFIYDPWRDDTVMAVRGKGAFLVRRDGGRTRLTVAGPVPFREMVASLSWRYMASPMREAVLLGLPRFGSTIELRCAAHGYRLLAMGQCHAGLFLRTLPWDHAAGVLIFQEAGGHAAQLNGTAWRPNNLHGGLLLACNETSWHEVKAVLQI
jgi:fructose-1,6-bisphosphatase/inositol monophosphatase family enzyme